MVSIKLALIIDTVSANFCVCVKKISHVWALNKHYWAVFSCDVVVVVVAFICLRVLYKVVAAFQSVYEIGECAH